MSLPLPFQQQQLLRSLVASSSTFQTEVGAGSQSAAKSYVHRFQALEKWHPAPRAVIRFSNHTSNDAGRGHWKSTSRIWLTVELTRDIAADTSTALATQEQEVIDKFAAIENEIKTNSGNVEDPDNLGFTYVRVTGMNMVDYDLVLSSEMDENLQLDPESGGTQQCIWWMAWEVMTA